MDSDNPRSHTQSHGEGVATESYRTHSVDSNDEKPEDESVRGSIVDDLVTNQQQIPQSESDSPSRSLSQQWAKSEDVTKKLTDVKEQVKAMEAASVTTD